MPDISRTWPRTGPIRLQRDGFGLWPGEGFWQTMCDESIDGAIPAESESGLIECELPSAACPTTTASIMKPMREVMAFMLRRHEGKETAYAPADPKE